MKISEMTEITVMDDDLLFPAVDTNAQTNNRATFGNLADWIANGKQYDSLDTENKSLVSAVNTIKSAMDSQEEEIVADKAVAIPSDISGTVIGIDDAVKDSIVNSLVLNLVPNQNLNGYDHPWVGGAGKNKLPPWHTSTTNYGVTYKVNDDGTFTTSGTATANSQIISPAFTLPAGTYVLTGMPTTGSGSTIYMRALQYQSDGTTLVGALANDYGSGGSFTITAEDISNGYVIKCFTAIQNGQAAPSGTWKPMIRLSSVTDATYEPYSNICPITGYDSVNLYRAGRNLLPPLYTSKTTNGITFDVQEDGGIHVYGTNNTSSTAYLVSGNNQYLYLPRGLYAYHGSNVSDTLQMYLNWRPADESAASAGSTHDVGNGAARSFDVDVVVMLQLAVTKGTTVDTVVYPMLVRGEGIASEAIADAMTYEPYKGEIIPISFSSAGTVYGGSLDVTSGVLTVDRVMKEFDGSSDETWTTLTTANVFRHNALDPLVDDSRRVSGTISNECYVSSYSYANMKENYPSISFDTNGRLFLAISDDHTTVTQCKAWLAENPLQVCYYLNTPITYNLTPTEVTMLLGNNTIWMDANGTIDMTYAIDTKTYIDNAIANAIAQLSA